MVTSGWKPVIELATEHGAAKPSLEVFRQHGNVCEYPDNGRFWRRIRLSYLVVLAFGRPEKTSNEEERKMLYSIGCFGVRISESPLVLPSLNLIHGPRQDTSVEQRIRSGVPTFDDDLRAS